MFTAWILLMLNSLFFTLRLSGGGSGSFPRPLKAEEERMYLERMAQGDLEARNNPHRAQPAPGGAHYE